ncbi:MAG: RDD family protein [Candidatus Deferrimicrobiaceae bacterium]
MTGLLTMREEHQYAGFWIRLVARVIDLILLLAAFNLFILGDRMGADAGLWAPTGLDNGIGFDQLSVENLTRGVFFLLFPVFYYVYLHGAYGQTFGKMALRIKVLNEDGSSLTYRKAFLRWLGYFLCDLTLNIGYIWAAFDMRKQGLHDKVCRTIVVHENSATGA